MIDPHNLHKNLLLKIFTSVSRREEDESERDYWIVLPLFVRANGRTVTGGRVIGEGWRRINSSRENRFGWTRFAGASEGLDVVFTQTRADLLPAACHNRADHGPCFI